jgi:hypothetical protein
MMAEYDDLTVNLDYTKFYDAWQAHINTWSTNDIDENKKDGTIHANHAPITINVSNSFVGKAGGPAIFTMTADPDEVWNAQSKTVVNIDDKSEVFSYVVGDEAWFVAHGISGQVGLISGISDKLGPNASFKIQFADADKDDNGNSNNFMNLIMINMDPGYIPAIDLENPSDEDIIPGNDIDGSLTIGGTTALDMEDGMRDVYIPEMGGFVTIPSNYGSGYVDVVKNQAINDGAKFLPPILVSSAGGVGYSDLKNFTPVTGADAYQGDYIALYWYNLGIALGFNEGEDVDGDGVVDLGKLATEPKPYDTPLVTVSHGYN